MLIKYRYCVLFFFSLFINTVFAKAVFKPERYPPNLASFVKVGDWVFRNGEQIDSLIVHQLGGGDFSHIGVIVLVTPKVKIVHATTDDDLKHLNQVIESDFEDFIKPELAETYAIARPNFLSDTQQQKIINELLSQVGARFALSDRDNQPRYCTTIIADAITQYDPSFHVTWQYVQFPFASGYYLFPSAFANRNDITWIYRYP